MSTANTPAFICLDLETTGLDFEKCCILEVGIVIADENLDEIHSADWLVEPTTDLSEVNEFVDEMHRKNGLWLDLHEEGPHRGVVAVEAEILAWLEELGLDEGTFPMFGSSIGFDRRMLQTHMPKLEAWFHYRNIDISTVKELARTWRPDVKWKPAGQKAHRVIDDCLATLDEARFYKSEFFTASED